MLLTTTEFTGLEVIVKFADDDPAGTTTLEGKEIVLSPVS
jgi:hypothetical protein